MNDLIPAFNIAIEQISFNSLPILIVYFEEKDIRKTSAEIGRCQNIFLGRDYYMYNTIIFQ